MIQNKLKVNNNQTNYSKSQKVKLLTKLIEAVSFENFLHTKFVGQKRFSLEGGESLIPARYINRRSSKQWGRGICYGYGTSGELSTLVNIFGKSAESVFSEFEGKDYKEKILMGM